MCDTKNKNRVCPFCGYDISECICGDDDWDEDDDDWRTMKKNHPEHTDESCKTGNALGVDFPYVPGDPFW